MYQLFQVCSICILLILHFNNVSYAQETVNDPSTAFPQDLQLYARDVSNNEAVVQLSGVLSPDTYMQINIEVYRNSEPWFNVLQPITYTQNSYNYDVTIKAELAEYSFYLYGTTHSGEKNLLKLARRVVAGDAYLVSGQSNAMATGVMGMAERKLNEHPFSRTFSTPDPELTLSENAFWKESKSRGTDQFTAIGIWSARLCRLIIETQSIPCAIINGAYPGVPSTYFARNDTQPSDLETNYGRTLWRVRESGLVNSIRAILWYQGEDDAWRPGLHEEQMKALRQDWLEDYSNIEHTYIMQIRYGCGFNYADNQLFEIQRQFGEWENTSILSTNGIPEYDGCHYYAPGYEKLGEDVYRTISRDLYGASQDNVEPPDILSALQTTPSTIVVTLDMPSGDSLRFDQGFHVDFTISEWGNINFIPFQGVASGNMITLTLARTADLYDATLSYVGGETAVQFGHDLEDIAWVTNQKGVGLLNFSGIPIELLTLPTGDPDETTEDVPLTVSQHGVGVSAKQSFSWTFLIAALLIIATITESKRMHSITHTDAP